MTSGTVASRERIVIVDRDLDFGLKLADCLASSGYHAVLSRSLDAMLPELSEMQPGAILLSSDVRAQEGDAAVAETLQAVKALCPRAPVINLMKPRHDRFPELFSQRASAGDAATKSARMEAFLQGKLGISCARML
jgi:DNA-binding NtrC family response regulator